MLELNFFKFNNDNNILNQKLFWYIIDKNPNIIYTEYGTIKNTSKGKKDNWELISTNEEQLSFSEIKRTKDITYFGLTNNEINKNKYYGLELDLEEATFHTFNNTTFNIFIMDHGNNTNYYLNNFKDNDPKIYIYDLHILYKVKKEIKKDNSLDLSNIIIGYSAIAMFKDSDKIIDYTIKAIPNNSQKLHYPKFEILFKPNFDFTGSVELYVNSDSYILYKSENKLNRKGKLNITKDTTFKSLFKYVK